MDPGRNTEARSLHGYTLTRSEGRLSSDVELILHGQTADDAEMQVSEKDILNMFYTVENLRKQQDDGQEGEDGEDGGSAAPEDGEPETLVNPATAQDECMLQTHETGEAFK